MKKIVSVLLTLAMVLSLVPSVFAADEPTITMRADKTEVAPGETVTLTLSIDQAFDADAVGFEISFDNAAYTLTSAKNCQASGATRLIFTNTDVANNSGRVAATYLQTGFDKNDPYHTSWAAKDWASFTFTAKEGVDASTAKFALTISKLLTYSGDGASQVQVPHNVVGSELTIPVETPEAKGYTVSLGEDKTVVSGEAVEIPVTIGNTAGKNTYNAYDMTFSYDQTVLKPAMEAVSTEGSRVTVGNGTIHVIRYGKTAELGEALTLKFTVIGQASTEVKITAAKVDISENALTEDAPDAIITDDTTAITFGGYSVDLPDGFTRTDAEGSVIAAGGTLTFKPADPNYDYTVTVTVGDGEATTVSPDEDGIYTVPNVNGNVIVTSEKTAKSFNVTLGNDTTGAATATYKKDYTFKLTPVVGYTYNMAVTIGGKDYTGFTPTANDDGSTTYTIPGADVTGDIVINSNKQVKPLATFQVSFEGAGAGDAKGESSVKENDTYTFTVDKKENFKYTITATMGGTAVELKETAGAENANVVTYSIDKVTGDLIITVNKESTLTMKVAVSEYVQMDDKTVFLVTVTGTPAEGKAYAYGENVMYKTTAYGANVYSWLVIVDKGQEFTAAVAEANITEAAATAEEVAQSYDVNETNVVDINDAQLTYDIYSGKYGDFEKVSVRKFLRADVNCDKLVNAQDAVAVVANSK